MVRTTAPDHLAEQTDSERCFIGHRAKLSQFWDNLHAFASDLSQSERAKLRLSALHWTLEQAELRFTSGYDDDS